MVTVGRVASAGFLEIPKGAVKVPAQTFSSKCLNIFRNTCRITCSSGKKRQGLKGEGALTDQLTDQRQA
eukprot:1161712-Pelagomonas_calceolata.AAC.14